jgi:uncharacterized protein (UPF0261 family)
MVPKGVLVKEVPAHVNDPLFAEEVLKAFLEITAGLGR